MTSRVVLRLAGITDARVRRGSLLALFAFALTLSCVHSRPDTPTAPVGPDSVEPGLPYLFKACVSSAMKGQPFIRFDWGDGDTSVWCGPGETAWYSHSWSDRGVFEVRAQARDDRAGFSEWSASFAVTSFAPFPYKVVDSVYVPDGVLEARVSPNDRFVYVAGYFSASLYAVRTSDLQVTQIPFYYAYPWWGAGAGGRMVCSPDGEYVYASYYREDYLAVIRATSQTVVDSLMLRATVNCLAVSPDGRRLYAAVYPYSGYTGDFILVVKLPDNTVEDTIFTLGANNNVSSMIVSPDGSRLYAADQGDGRVSAIRLSDKSIEWQDSASAAEGPRGIVLHPTGNPLYVLEDRCVTVRESSTGVVIDSIPLRPFWNGDISSDGAFLYVMCKDTAGSDAVAVVRTSDNKLLRTISMPFGVGDLAPSWDGLRLYVAPTEDEALYVLGR